MQVNIYTQRCDVDICVYERDRIFAGTQTVVERAIQLI